MHTLQLVSPQPAYDARTELLAETRYEENSLERRPYGKEGMEEMDATTLPPISSTQLGHIEGAGLELSERGTCQWLQAQTISLELGSTSLAWPGHSSAL